MKVDLGTCAVCGAKNSKFVESCYKCGAALPWAPGYVAPKAPEPAAKPQSAPIPAPKPAPSPQNAPKPTPHSTDSSKPAPEIKTVVSPPLDLESFADNKAPLTDSMAERASRRVPIPTWAIGAGVLGCIGLGMALMTAFGGRNSVPATVAPALTPLPTSAPVASATPIATTSATVVPTVAPVTAVAPVPAPTVAPPATSIPIPPPVRVGPTFDEVDAKMDDRSNALTEAQKQTYWQKVSGSTIRWRGAVTDAQLSGGGQISMRCGKQTQTSDVTVALDGSQGPLLGEIGKGENITIEGILQDHTGSGYTISKGKIVDRR